MTMLWWCFGRFFLILNTMCPIFFSFDEINLIRLMAEIKFSLYFSHWTFFHTFFKPIEIPFFLYSKKIERKKKIETACPLITIFFRCVFPLCTVSGLFCILDDWTVRSTSNKHRKKWNGKRFTDFFSAFDWKRKTKFFISFREF